MPTIRDQGSAGMRCRVGSPVRAGGLADHLHAVHQGMLEHDVVIEVGAPPAGRDRDSVTARAEHVLQTLAVGDGTLTRHTAPAVRARPAGGCGRR